MIVRGGTTPVRALAEDWPALLYFLLLSLTAEFVYDHTPLGHSALPALPLGTLIAAMSIFVAFKINQSYERWWEARILWGQMVNESRSFGRQVTTLVTERRLTGIGDRRQARIRQAALVYRHIAYINTLRLLLRGGGVVTDDGWREVAPFLPAPELGSLRRAANPATWLIHKQARELAGLAATDFREQQILLALDATLNRFYDIQGGCERIKRTAFPERVSFHTRLFAWILATLIPFAMIQTDHRFDAVAILVETFLAFVFITIVKLGNELNDPFEGKANDTPMTALCRTIEIDLRQQLGERDVPPPITPHKGVLM